MPAVVRWRSGSRAHTPLRARCASDCRSPSTTRARGSLIVTDLQVLLVEDPAQPPLRWIAAVSQLRPESSNERDFATPFAVAGRATREIVAELGHGQGWSPSPGTRHRMRLMVRLHDRGDEWCTLAEFDWWAPPPGAEMDRYITYRNAPLDEEA
jgi:hypothetical protein